MPPEQPPYLVILDTAFGAAGLKGRVEYVKPASHRLRVRWGVGSPPTGFKKEGGGVVFVADASASPLPPSEIPLIPKDQHGRYPYEEGLGGAEWLMLVMILPQGYVLSNPDPPPAGSSLFGDRLAFYWRLSKTGVPEFIRVEWELRVGNVREILQGSQPPAPFPFDADEAAPAFGVFLSYRRNDHWAVGRITDRLIHSFGADAVFRDINSIALGADFRQEIDDAVGECMVMLAVIGQTWLDPSSPIGRRRIDSESDWVRIEIESALQRHRSIIPLLLDDAQMPDETLLPDSLRELAFRQACTLRETTFDPDVQPLIEALRVHMRRTQTNPTKDAGHY